MIKRYDILRQKYIVDGYAQAYQYLQSLQPQSEEQQILLSNFYCYITIQSQFKVHQAIKILQSCLQKTSCISSIKALTLYHISQALFKIGQFQLCMEKCKKIIAEFIGQYYSLERRLQKSEKQCLVCDQIQQILYYAFLMVAYVLKNEQKTSDSKVFLDAGMRIMNDRKNLMTLTRNAKSANSSFENGKENKLKKQDSQYKTF